MNAKQGTALATDKIVTHFKPHADEFVAIYLLRRFGQELFPGISDAKIITKDGSVKLYNRKGWLKVGIGEGIFDEHGQLNCCCADLVAQYLGIDHLPKIILLLKHIRRGDLFGKSTTYDLSECIKNLNHDGWSPAKIEKWLATFLDCYFDDKTIIKGSSVDDDHQGYIFPISDGETRTLFSNNTLYRDWLKKKNLKSNQPEVSKLTNNLNQFTKRPPSKIFDICEGAYLIAVYLGKLESFTWTSAIFEASKNYQQEFLEACDIVKPMKVIVVRPYDNCNKANIIRILAIDRTINRQGNKCLLNAAKFLNKNLDVLVIQQPNGSIQVFITNIHLMHLWPMIVRAIRLEEMVVNDMPIDSIITDYDVLAQTGSLTELPQLPLWYFPANGNGDGWALLNGALTLPNVIPSNIYFDEIVNIIKTMIFYNDDKNTWQNYADNRIDEYHDSCNKPSTGNCLGDYSAL
ncbi:MAG: hypothetical protein ACNFW9_03815 [Candidatus Kerfeldbacteria bacterium]